MGPKLRDELLRERPRRTQSEKLLKEKFDRIGNNPESWFQQAEGLLAAVKILLERQNDLHRQDEMGNAVMLNRPTQLLRGFALEVLLRGLWLKRKGAIAKEGRYVGPTTHDLGRLAREVGLELSDEEESVLTRLAIYTTAYGRYPVARDWRKTKPGTHLHGYGSPAYWRTDDDSIFDEIVCRLQKEIC